MSTQHNPFPGPRPYERNEKDLFFGRDLLAARLLDHVLAEPCTLLYGPSGAGKSSLVQAALVPQLIESAQGYRVLTLDHWPTDEEPLAHVVTAMYAKFELGAPPDKPDVPAVAASVDLAFQIADDPLLLSFDQIEQLLYPGRDVQQSLALFDALERAARMHPRGLAIILGIREDYLGLFRDRLRGRRILLDHGFRVGPMVVREMVSAVCTAAEKHGQTWDAEKMRALILQMRERPFIEQDGSSKRTKDVEDQDEVQAAFVQIVCRALWESSREDLDAQQIVAKYLEEKLAGIAADERHFLEDHLIDEGGHRIILTAKQAAERLGEERAAALLQGLEQAAIVRGAEYHDDRRYELGHDWLAQRLRELRAAREKAEDERQAQRQIEKAKQARHRAYAIAAIAVVIALVMVGLALWAKEQSKLARTRSIMAGVREHMAKHENHWAAKLLLEIEDPEDTREWVNLAVQVLDTGMRYRGLAPDNPRNLPILEWSPDGTRVVMVMDDGVRVERVFGNDGPWEIKPVAGMGRVTSAAWSPSGNRIALADEHGGLYVWALEGRTVLLREGKKDAPIGYKVAWSADGRLLVWNEHVAEVWDVVGKVVKDSVSNREGGIYWAGFIRGNPWAFTQDSENVVSLQRIDNRDEVIVLGEVPPLHGAQILFPGVEFSRKTVDVSPDGNWVLTRVDLDTWKSRRTNLWRADGLLEPISDSSPQMWQQFSPNGEWILGTNDKAEIVLWSIDEQKVVKRVAVREPTFRATMSPKGTWIGATDPRGGVKIWKTASLQEQEGRLFGEVVLDVVRNRRYGDFLSFSPDERAILVYNNIEGAEAWKTKSSREPERLRVADLERVGAGWKIDDTWTINKPLAAIPTDSALRTADSPNHEWTAGYAPERVAIKVRRMKSKDSTRVYRWFDVYNLCIPEKVEFSPDSTRLAAHCVGGMILIWTVSIPGLQQRLREANIDCLPPALRQLHLDESETEAKANYDACEKSYRRIPFEALPVAPQLQNPAAN